MGNMDGTVDLDVRSSAPRGNIWKEAIFSVGERVRVDSGSIGTIARWVPEHSRWGVDLPEGGKLAYLPQQLRKIQKQEGRASSLLHPNTEPSPLSPDFQMVDYAIGASLEI